MSIKKALIMVTEITTLHCTCKINTYLIFITLMLKDNEIGKLSNCAIISNNCIYRKPGIRSRPQIEALVKYNFYLVNFGQKFRQNQ